MEVIQKLKEILERSNKKERIVIIDTSALQSKECMQIIDEADKVILLTGIISEMDKRKHIRNMQGMNIREISRRSRNDKDSKKYICVSKYQKYKYQDDNIIDYCKKHKNTIILTSDNNLCNMAKAYGISYIFFEMKEKRKSKQKEVEQKTEPKDTSSESVQNEKKDNSPKEKIKGECSEFFFYPRWIRAKQKKGYKIFFRVERDGVQVKTQNYKLGDLIYMCKYNVKHNKVELYVYKIVLKNEQYDIEKMYEYDIKFINEFYRVKCSEELRDQMTEFYVKNARY